MNAGFLLDKSNWSIHVVSCRGRRQVCITSLREQCINLWPLWYCNIRRVPRSGDSGIILHCQGTVRWSSLGFSSGDIPPSVTERQFVLSASKVTIYVHLSCVQTVNQMGFLMYFLNVFFS